MRHIQPASGQHPSSVPHGTTMVRSVYCCAALYLNVSWTAMSIPTWFNTSNGPRGTQKQTKKAENIGGSFTSVKKKWKGWK